MNEIQNVDGLTNLNEVRTNTPEPSLVGAALNEFALKIFLSGGRPVPGGQWMEQNYGDALVWREWIIPSNYLPHGDKFAWYHDSNGKSYLQHIDSGMWVGYDAIYNCLGLYPWINVRVNPWKDLGNGMFAADDGSEKVITYLHKKFSIDCDNEDWLMVAPRSNNNNIVYFQYG